MDVVATDSQETVISTPARLTRAHLTCPLIPDAACGQLCRLHGGPWISRSIHAAGWWGANHAKRLVDAGCDTCGDGAVMISIKSAKGQRLYDGFSAPGAVDVERGQNIGIGSDVSSWPSDNRYARRVPIE